MSCVASAALIALPLLDCMNPLRAAEAPKPKRSVFIYLPNGGQHPRLTRITTPGKDYEFSRSLRPLEKTSRCRGLPISGLHHPGGLGHHHNCQKIWLTGGKLGPS